ncbi:MAG: sigma-70 family RNA polymerase sigma factor [Acidobacteria bacterium]|nr:sigma-70 family RNA polymerase sigma factor [Acidobacteriota bacterium]
MPFDPDTAMGGGSGKFPLTHHSAMASLRSEQEPVRTRAMEAILTAYWKPAYKYLRIQWNRGNEDAKDLTQGFFAQAVEKGWFAAYSPEKGSFRSFLRSCLDGYVSHQDEAASRLKRGGGVVTVSLDFETAEGELAELPVAGGMSTEEYFRREWIRHLFSTAVDQLRQECGRTQKQKHFLLFQSYDIEETAASYQDMARQLDLTVTAVNNHLAWARRRFRQIVLDRVREVCGSEEEYQREVRDVLGVAVK